MGTQRRPQARGDEGAVLVIALLFIGVVAVLITSVISISTTSTRGVSVTREYVAKRYAADAGLKYAVQQLRTKSEYCGSNSPSLQPPSDFLTSNGGPFTANTPTPTVAVTCAAAGGTPQAGAAGYALITRDTSTDGITVSGPGQLPINGPVFVASHPASLPFTVTKGDYWTLSSGGSCAPKPTQLSLQTPPYTYQCQGSIPAPTITLPDAIPPAHGPDPDRVIGSDCAVFKPGTYTSIDLNYPHLYFASGVYYFKNVDLTITDRDLFAGRPISLTDIFTTGTPCTNDLAAAGLPGAGITGTGVKLILGGSSRIVADNPRGVVEIYARAGGDASEGTQDVSVMTVPQSPPAAAGGTWTPSTNDFASLRFGVTNVTGGGGQTMSLGVHGLVYVPDGLVDLRNDSSESRLQGGLVAGRLAISTSNNIGGFVIGVNITETARRMHVTSIATGFGTSDRPLIATADIVVDDSTNRVYFTSWANSQ